MPKMFLVYFLGSVIFTNFIFLVLDKKIVINFPQLIKDRIFLCACIFLLINIFSFSINLLFGAEWYTMFFGYYGRFSGGLLSLLYYFGLYFVAKHVFEKSDYEKLLNFGVISYLLVLVFAFFQQLGLFGNVPERIYGTFGQPNWLANFIVLLTPLVLHKFVFSKKYERVIWLGMFVLSVTVLWLTYSTSGFIGLVVGVLAYLIINRKALGKYIYFLFSTFLGLLIFLLIFNPGIFLDKVYDAYYSVFGTGVEFRASDPGVIRLGVWQGTLNLAFSSFKNLLVGVGPERFPYEFPFFRVGKLNYASEWDFIVNKPHNYFLEVLSELGIFGLVSFVFLSVYLIKKLKPELSSGVIAMLICLVFGFPVVAIEVWFWFLLASDL